MTSTQKPLIGPKTRLCMSLSARPSPFGTRFHNKMYEELGLDFVYKAFSTTDLPAAIGGVRALGIRGCAISMPFKEAVIPLLDTLEQSASAIDSVNTIVNDDGHLTGYNTDYIAIYDLLAAAKIDPATPFLLRGSGGMAKAVAAALKNSGHEKGTIVARNEKTGPALADLYGFDWAPTTEGLTAPLIINVTPMGMQGQEADMLAFDEEIIKASDYVFDVVAMPAETPLMQTAEKHGKTCISGAEVIVLQAVEQFELYTGIRPDRALIEKASAFSHAVAREERLQSLK